MSFIIIFIIFCVIKSFFSFLKEEDTKTQDSRSSSATNSNHNAQNGSAFSDFFPFSDLFSYYAQVDNRTWTSDKVKHIKWILEEHVTNDWDKTLLKERLKLKNVSSLNYLINAFKNSKGASRDRDVSAVTLICQMLYFDDVSTDKIKEKINYLGGNLGLSSVDLSKIYNNVFEEDASSKNSNQNSDNYSRNHSIEWACKILEIQLNHVSHDKIQQAYRLKIKEYHPDKHQSLSDSIKQLLHERTQDLNEAKDILVKSLG